MSYVYRASGLPPGLALVGDQILGTPSTPGNYSVTITVFDDGGASVSETVSVTIGAVPVPVPFWQLLVELNDVAYNRESFYVQRAATVDDVAYWRESFSLIPKVTVDDVFYWRDEVEGMGDYVVTSTGDRVVTSTGDRVVRQTDDQETTA